MTTPASWVNCCPDIIDASIEIGSAGEGSRGERIRRPSCAIRHTGGEERPVRLHCGRSQRDRFAIAQPEESQLNVQKGALNFLRG